MPINVISLPGGSVDLTKRRKEMMLFETLGPKSRVVIADSPIDIDLERMLAQFRQADANARSRCIDQDEGKMAASMATFDQGRDGRLAKWIGDCIRQKAPGYKPIERRARKHG